MFIPGEHVHRWAEIGRAQRTALEIADETTAREVSLVGPDSVIALIWTNSIFLIWDSVLYIGDSMCAA